MIQIVAALGGIVVVLYLLMKLSETSGLGKLLAAVLTYLLVAILFG